MRPRVKCLGLQRVIFVGTTNLLESLQQINTIHFGGAITALVKEVEGEKVILIGIAQASPVCQLGRRLWEDG